MAATLAAQDAPVLITGETGTGKELFARAIHRMSCRKHAPVIGVPCDTIPEQLLETEFFGDAPSSASVLQPRCRVFVRAAGGTVLFEEIAALPLRLQERVLEAIEGRVAGGANGGLTRDRDVRVIGTSTKPLAAEVERGQFLGELHQRLRAAHIRLPPLRERPEDIPGLLAHFAQQAAGVLGRPISLTPQALSLLTAYPWPGNVRELRHEVERAAALSPTGRLDRGDFGLTGSGRDLAGGGPDTEAGVGGPTLKLKPQVESFERNAIRRALAAASGNRREAAQLLGVSLRTLFYKLRRYGLE
jgi:DNA-binding NtrC family response regulator